MSLTDEQRARIANAADNWIGPGRGDAIDEAAFDAAILAPFAELIRVAQQAVHALRTGDGADRAFAATHLENQLAGLGIVAEPEPDGLAAMRQAAEGGR